MGAQQVLRAAVAIASTIVASGASAAPTKLHERVAVIDLGPRDAAIEKQLSTAVIAAGLELVIGDGIEDALAGASADPDALTLAAAIDDAQRAFGALDCKGATAAAKRAAGIGAARQAAGIAVTDLARAWSYILLCADRAGDTDAALLASARIATLGGASDVPKDILDKYPPVDTIADRDVIEIDVKTDAGAKIWIDHEYRGVAPLHVAVPGGEPQIAAALGAKRGWASGTPIKAQPVVEVPLVSQRGKFDDLATEVTGWHGKLPTPAQLAKVLVRVRARIALVRHGDTIEAFGQSGVTDMPHQLGGDDGVAPVAEVARVLALVSDRVHTWNDRAPDPDRALLVEDLKDRASKTKEHPTEWWVYATIIGALGGVALAVYLHDQGSDMQRVELHYP